MLFRSTVVAIHEPSGTKYGTVTNYDGRYSLDGMRTGGPYKVTFSYVGYEPIIKSGITLQLGENYILDVDMHESSETLADLVVVGTKSKFNTMKTGASTNISNNQLKLLPSINRSISDFTRLSPYSGANNSIGGRDGRTNSFRSDERRVGKECTPWCSSLLSLYVQSKTKDGQLHKD